MALCGHSGEGTVEGNALLAQSSWPCGLFCRRLLVHFCHLVPSMSCLLGMCRNANCSRTYLKQLGALLIGHTIRLLRHQGSSACAKHPKLLELLFSSCQPVLKLVIYIVIPALQQGCEDQLCLKCHAHLCSLSATSEKDSAYIGITHISKA